MFDTVRLQQKGIPVVALVHDRFEAAARANSIAAGSTSARIVVIPEPGPKPSESDLFDRIDNAWNEIVASLVEPSS